MPVNKTSVLQIGVLASGRGTNFQSIIDAIAKGNLRAEIRVLITDNPSAYAIERAKKHSIECLVMHPSVFASREEYFGEMAGELKKRNTDLLVLAGFMRIVGKALIHAFPGRIMNIHPALLPAFPGLHGQKQALEYGVRIAGCTVHFVDEGMDTGPIIIQAAVPVFQGDTEETLSSRILSCEHEIYPEAIRLFAEGRLEIMGRHVRINNYTAVDNSFTNPSAGT